MMLSALVNAQVDVNRAVFAGNHHVSHDGTGHICDPSGKIVTAEAGLWTTVDERNTYIEHCIRQAQGALTAALKHYAKQRELFS